MIIGKRFVWEHVPKTGGDATATMFGMVPNLVEYADRLDDVRKHDPLARHGKVAGVDLNDPRERVLNIRRLPSWMLSYAQHGHRRYGLPFDECDLREGRLVVPHFRTSERLYVSLMPKLQRFGRLRNFLNKVMTKRLSFESPDGILKSYDAENVKHWLRQENLLEDFLAIARRFGEVSDEQENAIRSLGYVNKNSYSQAWENIYTKKDLERLYELNPLWASVERKAYGGTLLDQFSECLS